MFSLSLRPTEDLARGAHLSLRYGPADLGVLHRLHLKVLILGPHVASAHRHLHMH